jgi:hypothetical protein
VLGVDQRWMRGFAGGYEWASSGCAAGVESDRDDREI